VGVVLGLMDRLLGTYSPASNVGLLSGIYGLAILVPSWP